MTLTTRDKRAIGVLIPVLVFTGIYMYSSSSSSSSSTAIVGAVDSVDRAEKRLANIRKAVATLPAKQAILDQSNAELTSREKWLVPGDTPEQAQAQLLQILRRIAKSQTPPMEIRQVELGQARAYGDAYGQVSASITMDCRIEELVNYMTSLSSAPEEIATEDIRFGVAHPKQKIMPVRLTVSGIVARKLIPEKKGPQL